MYLVTQLRMLLSSRNIRATLRDCWFRKFSTSKQLLYVGTIRSCMDYCGHIWGGSIGVRLLYRVQSKAICFIPSPALFFLPSLSLRRDVWSLCLVYRYNFAAARWSYMNECLVPHIVQSLQDNPMIRI